MKLSLKKPGFSSALLLGLVMALLLVPGQSSAQVSPTWWGSTSWFDWSDYRLETGVSVFMASLSSGAVNGPGYEADLVDDLGFGSDPEQFRDAWFALYIDRVALRFHYEQEWIFAGRARDDMPQTLSSLDMSAVRLGLDVDLIRYPMFKCGVNFDYMNDPPRLIDRSLNDGQDPANVPRAYIGSEIYTIGVHARAIPFRIREVPLVIRGRVRFPISFMDTRPVDSEMLAFEASAGLRPSVWETSLRGHSTFAASVDVGYRLQRMWTNLERQGISFKAQWEGPFVQFMLTY